MVSKLTSAKRRGSIHNWFGRKKHLALSVTISSTQSKYAIKSYSWFTEREDRLSENILPDVA